MERDLHLHTTDAEELQEALEPIVGPFQLRPASGSRLHASVTANHLENLGIFTVKANPINVRIEPPLPFFGINLPLGSPFSVNEGNRRHEFRNDVHLVTPDREMALEAATGCRVLAVCLDYEPTRRYAQKLDPADRPLESEMQPRLHISSPSGHALVCSLYRMWSELQAGEPGSDPDIHVTETEDAVLAHFVLAARQGTAGQEKSNTRAASHCIANAEAYLCAHIDRPVLRADLAEVSGVSIRTLSRAFVKRHGMGPMQFLKARRMEAAYRELLGSEAGTTSVTEVALHYGFSHLGRFASDYRRTFRESPSRTLNH